MAEQATSIVQESRERLHEVRERLDEEIQRVQKELQSRRKRIERQLVSGRRTLEKQTRKQVRQIQNDLTNNTLVRRIDELRVETARQIEDAIEGFLSVLQIASKNDVRKIDRKLTKLNKRLKDMERARSANGQRAPAAQL